MSWQAERGLGVFVPGSTTASPPVVSTQDRVVTAISLAVGPFAVAGILAVLKKPKASAIFAGLGVVGGVFGAVAPSWFMPKAGPSPLATRGWAEGLPTWSGALAKVTGSSEAAPINAGLVAQGGYAYSEDAFTYSNPLARPAGTRGSVLDSGQRLNGVMGYQVR